MIDRNYLPFQSAREHHDRGMQKWMGFFLSEHTILLGEDKSKVEMSQTLTKLEKLTLIGQLYASGLTGMFVVKIGKVKESCLGQVTEMSPIEITIKSRDGYRMIQVDDILEISLIEELDDEQKRNL